MSGHSKWATTKHKKAVVDAKRSKLFAKLIKTIEVAARTGGGDPAGNPTLADAIQGAKRLSVPADNIERAIKRGSGAEGGGARYDEVIYEGYAPGGVAVLVEALTDNRNRTSQEVRHAFTKGGGNLGEQGSVGWMFHRRGLIEADKETAPTEERLLEIIAEAGADDLTDAGEQWEIVTEPDTLRAVRKALEEAGVPLSSAELTMIPQTTVPVGADRAASVLRLVEALEDLEDVQAVHANFDIPDEVLAEVG